LIKFRSKERLDNLKSQTNFMSHFVLIIFPSLGTIISQTIAIMSILSVIKLLSMLIWLVDITICETEPYVTNDITFHSLSRNSNIFFKINSSYVIFKCLAAHVH